VVECLSQNKILRRNLKSQRTGETNMMGKCVFVTTALFHPFKLQTEEDSLILSELGRIQFVPRYCCLWESLFFSEPKRRRTRNTKASRNPSISRREEKAKVGSLR
jgi:hypothetical protein